LAASRFSLVMLMMATISCTGNTPTDGGVDGGGTDVAGDTPNGGCDSSGGCTDPLLPVCDTEAHACVKCATDAQCLAKDSTKPACDVASGAC
jgi:hypothetical protein